MQGIEREIVGDPNATGRCRKRGAVRCNVLAESGCMLFACDHPIV